MFGKIKETDRSCTDDRIIMVEEFIAGLPAFDGCSSVMSLSTRVAWLEGEPALLVSYIVWRQGAGHSWRTQGGDGSLGSNVPGGLAGKTCLYYSYHKLLPPPGGCLAIWFARYFPFVIFSLVLCLTLFTSSGVFVIFFFFPARSFSSVGHLACGGGGTTDCFS